MTMLVEHTDLRDKGSPIPQSNPDPCLNDPGTPQPDADAQAALLKRAAGLLNQARECRALAATIGKKKAAGVLQALALELESRAQVLVTRAENID